MRPSDIAHVRNLIAQGMADSDIAESLADDAAAAAEQDALYGPRDDEYSHGRTRRECDETYARNDAGEWLAFM